MLWSVVFRNSRGRCEMYMCCTKISGKWKHMWVHQFSLFHNNIDHSKMSQIKSSLYLPNKVLRGDHTGWYCIPKSVELNGLMRLKVLFAKENVEIGILFDWHIDLIWVFWTCGGRLGGLIVILSWWLHTLILINSIYICKIYDKALIKYYPISEIAEWLIDLLIKSKHFLQFKIWNKIEIKGYYWVAKNEQIQIFKNLAKSN